MLDNLLEIEVAYNLLRDEAAEDKTKNPIDANYEKLNTNITVSITVYSGSYHIKISSVMLFISRLEEIIIFPNWHSLKFCNALYTLQYTVVLKIIHGCCIRMTGLIEYLDITDDFKWTSVRSMLHELLLRGMIAV